MESIDTPEATSSERQGNVWNTVTPVSKYLALTLFIVLPFLGGYVGYVYAPEKIVEVETILITETESTIPKNTEVHSTDQLERDSVLAQYLSEYATQKSFHFDHSGLSREEFSQINEMITLASQDVSYTKQQREAVTDLYQKLFVDEERSQDAPSGRANKLIGTKLCVAKAIITNSQPTVVDDCAGGDAYPISIEWVTDDITAEAQIAPFYVLGSYYFEQAERQHFSAYYLNQVVRHYEQAKEEWGEEDLSQIAGEDYINMVRDAGLKLNAIFTQPI